MPTIAPGKTVLAGTDIGVFRSTDLGVSWAPFNLGVIPVVPVFDLEQNLDGVTYAGTHGRGAFELSGALGPIPTPTAFPTMMVATPTPVPTKTATPTPTRTATPTIDRHPDSVLSRRLRRLRGRHPDGDRDAIVHQPDHRAEAAALRQRDFRQHRRGIEAADHHPDQQQQQCRHDVRRKASADRRLRTTRSSRRARPAARLWARGRNATMRWCFSPARSAPAMPS